MSFKNNRRFTLTTIPQKIPNRISRGFTTKGMMQLVGLTCCWLCGLSLQLIGPRRLLGQFGRLEPIIHRIESIVET
jgi:hypothetical protein